MSENSSQWNPLDLLSAEKWDDVLFTTYSLSLSFFEAEVLDRLIRGGTSNVVIYSDVSGVRSALSEYGARQVGRSYQLEPVEVNGGVFHPKLALLFRDKDVHALVGSGNLTFGGWGMNLETLVHLHPSFARSAFDDIADMLDRLARDSRVRIANTKPLESAAERIRLTIAGLPESPNIRVIHNQGECIANQIALMSEHLGDARSITVASPFFDANGIGLKNLGARLGNPIIRVHVPNADSVGHDNQISWPWSLSPEPVLINFLAEDDRPLHAKLFEIVCEEGTVVVAGSANATQAALFGSNVEASVASIFYSREGSWKTSPASSPFRMELRSSDSDATETNFPVIRAVLEGGRLFGSILGASFTGPALVRVFSGARELVIRETVVNDAGDFVCPGDDIENELFRSEGRLTVRVEKCRQFAEGFVAQAEASKLMRVLGSYSLKLSSLLAGSETPEDFIDIGKVLIDSPELLAEMPAASNWSSRKVTRSEWVTADTLSPLPLRINGRLQKVSRSTATTLIQKFLRGLSAHRPPWEDEEVSDKPKEHVATSGDNRNPPDSNNDDEDHEKAVNTKPAELMTSQLVPALLKPANDGRQISTALLFANYVSSRGRPDPATSIDWLRQISNAVLDHPSQEPEVITAAAYYHALRRSNRGDAITRAVSFLRRVNIDPGAFTPDPSLLYGFIRASQIGAQQIEPRQEVEKFFASVAEGATAGQEIEKLIGHEGLQVRPAEFPILSQSPYWPELVAEIGNPIPGRRYSMLNDISEPCPHCFIQLPPESVDELRAFGVTDFHGLILWEGA